MRLASTGGNFPIDGAQVIALLIVADFLKIKPSSAQPGSMPSRQNAVTRLSGQKAEAAGFVLESYQVIQLSVDTGSWI
jgi:hypothetical protein